MVHEFLAGDDDEDSDLTYSIRQTTCNQAFFVTEMGLLELGPPDVKIGDEVWVLDSGNVPFTLRLRRHTEERGGHGSANGGYADLFKSHSETAELDFGRAYYVQGLMSGQLIIGEDSEPEKLLLRMK